MTKRAYISDYGVLSLADLLYSAGGGADAMLASDEIKNAVQTAIDETVSEAGGKKEYRQALEDNAMTSHLYRFYTSVEKIANELFFIARDDLGLLDDSDEYATEYMHSVKFIRTNHVYLEGKTAENLKLAEQIASRQATSPSRMSSQGQVLRRLENDDHARLLLCKGKFELRG